MFGFRKPAKRLNLALQGGGAHGAFTWGVLDRLLEEPRLAFGWLSGTSAGAINAVAMASGLAEGGHAGAAKTLRAVWTAVIEAGVPDLVRFNPFLLGLSRSSTMGHIGAQVGAQFGAMFSPYEFNPMGFDPLRKLLEAHIDFDRLRTAARTSGGVELLIAATDVATGRPRLFRRAELTVEAVLASACLPQLHHAVVIDGRAYWDGGFSANPDLLTLAAESPVGDTLLVLLNPVEKSGVPRTVRDIAAEANRLTFSQPLLRDIAEITAIARDGRGFFSRPGLRARRIGGHRFHLIEAGRHTEALAPESKLRPDRELLELLHGAGRDEAERWLGRSKADIGRRSSVDLGARFFGPMQPFASAKPEAAATQPQADAEAIAERL